MAITPRHYLDFINHYVSTVMLLLYAWMKLLIILLLQVKLFNEKRSDLEEQQLHLNVGLQKIRETVDQVEELQKSLSLKSQELEAKNALANQKLKQMVRWLAKLHFLTFLWMLDTANSRLYMLYFICHVSCINFRSRTNKKLRRRK